MAQIPITFWGIAPFMQTPLLSVPLTNSLNAARGTNTFTFAVATGFGNNGGFVSDWENNLRRCRPQEARFTGARRVENLIVGNSENLSVSPWQSYIGGTGVAPTITPNFGAGPVAGQGAGTRIQMNRGSLNADANVAWFQSAPAPGAVADYRLSAWIISNSGTPTIGLLFGYLITNITLLGPGTWRRYTTVVRSTDANSYPNGNCGVCIYGSAQGGVNHSQTADITVWGIHLENVSGQSNQNTGEYVSRGILVAPWHGCNVDAVKCFNTLNGNTVAGGIVTEAVGVPINTLNGASPYTCDRTAPWGLLKEMEQVQITNFFTESNFNSWTYKTAMSVVEAGSPGPTGEQLGSALVEDGTTNYHYLSHALSGLTGANIHFVESCYIAPGRWTIVLMRVNHPSFTWSCDQYFSLVGEGSLSGGQNVSGGVTPRGAGIIKCRNGYYRCWQAMTIPDPTGIAVGFAILFNGGSSYLGINGQAAHYVYGFALHDMSNYGDWFPPSYVSVPRGKDSLTFQAASNMNAAQGTAYAEIRTIWGSSTQNRPVVGFDVATNSALYLSNATAVSTSISIGDGTNVVHKGGLPEPRLTPRKVASSWGNGAFIRATGSGADPVSAAFDGAMGATAIGLGSQGINATTQSYNLCGNIRNVIVYGVAASNTELVSLTSGNLAEFLLAKFRAESEVTPK